MEWVKLASSPAFYLDGSLLRAGEAAEVLFCRGLAHCGSVESAGLIDKTVLSLLVSKAGPRADALVREGLWLDEGTHYRIRSWDKWQDEHDAAAERRRRDRERKRQRRRDVRGQSADASPGRPADASAADAESPALEGEREGEREKTPPATQVVSAPAPSADKPRPSNRSTRIPDEFPLTEHLLAWGREHAPGVDGRAETEQWLDYHRAKGDTAKDWTASWRTWMRRAQKDAERVTGGRALAVVGRPRPSSRDAAVAASRAAFAQARGELA